MPAAGSVVRVMFPARLTRGIERRMRADAERRVAEQMSGLSLLQGDLERAQERCRRAIAAVERRCRLAEAGVLIAADEANGAAPDVVEPNGRPEPNGERSTRLRLGSAGYADLRSLGLSVTQTSRVLERRRAGRLETVAELCRVAWLPRELREQLSQRLSD